MYNDTYLEIFQEEQKRIYRKIVTTQARLYNFVDQVQQNLSVFFDELSSTNDRLVFHCFEKILAFFDIVQQLLFIINEYRCITHEVIKIELVGLGGLVQYYMILLSKYSKYTYNLPCLSQIHSMIFEKLAVAVEFLFEIGRKNVLPVTVDNWSTPLSSPMGHIVIYSGGIF